MSHIICLLHPFSLYYFSSLFSSTPLSPTQVTYFLNDPYNISPNHSLCYNHRYYSITLREKSPNMELFLVRIFLYSDWIRRDTEYLFVLSPNTGKYGPEITQVFISDPRPEITPYLATFHAVSTTKIYFNCLSLAVFSNPMISLEDKYFL